MNATYTRQTVQAAELRVGDRIGTDLLSSGRVLSVRRQIPGGSHMTVVVERFGMGFSKVSYVVRYQPDEQVEISRKMEA